MSVPTHQQDLIALLEERGFVHQCTDRDGLAAHLAAGPAARQAAGFLVGIADEGVGVLDEVVHGGSPDRGAGRPFPVAGS